VVSLVGEDTQAGGRQRLGQVGRHRDGHDPVARAMPDLDRDGDGFELEAPGPGKNERLVVHAPAALSIELGRVRDHAVAQGLIGQHGLVGFAHVLERLVEETLGVAPLSPAPVPHGQPDDPRRAIGGANCIAVEPAQVARLASARQRRRRADQGDRRHALGQRVATGESIRTATGPTHDAEALDTQPIGELCDIGRPVQKTAARQRLGQADARSIDRNKAHTEVGRGLVGWADHAGGAESVKEEHGQAVGHTRLCVAEPAAVGKLKAPILGAHLILVRSPPRRQPRSITKDSHPYSRDDWACVVSQLIAAEEREC